MSKQLIYADHAATTKLSEYAKEAMMPWLSEEYGNPSTLYSLARKPRRAIEGARSKIANAIGAKPEEILFTSGGTEADNWALIGTILRYPHQKKRIITSAIEHHAILHTCSFLETLGYDVTVLPVDHQGIVKRDDFEAAIDKATVLASVMMANNEIGTIEPIHELVNIAHRRGVLFHTDAVQAVGHIPVNVKCLGVDMLSASAHKFNGPKGIGFLYVRSDASIAPYLYGGGQEFGMRSGTENVASIVGMACALEEHIAMQEQEGIILEKLRMQLITGLREANLDFLINGSDDHVPGSVSISFRNIEGEVLLHRLDLLGIEVGTGSACNSKETVVSHVIHAIKVPPMYAKGTLRITLGMDNTEADVARIIAAIARIAQLVDE